LLDELERDVKEAIEQHIAALKDIGQPIPKGRGAAEQGIRRWEIAIPA